MAHTLDVCIRGGGVVGRTLALLLGRDRLRVGLVVGAPAAQATRADVRAYALNAASRRLLESLRSWPEGPHCTAVAAMEIHGDAGGNVRFDAPSQHSEALAWIVDVSALESRLAEALRYQPQVEILDAPRPAALTVVCEGRSSTTRAEFGVGFDITAYPQRAIAARLSGDRPHGGVARQWFQPDGVVALLPMGGTEGSSLALVWSVETTRAASLMAMDDGAFTREIESAAGFAAGALTLQSPRADWPLQLARADRWTGTMPSDSVGQTAARGGWVLAGDAAHTVHPLAGQGLNLGLADAAALAHELHERDYWRSVGDPKLLRRYERARKAGLWPMGVATDGLQQLFSQPSQPWQAARNWGMRGFDSAGPVKSWLARQAMGSA